MIQDVSDITSFKWGTIKGISPLSVQLDGDTAPLALIPDSLIDPKTLSVGSRVRVELSLRKVVIHGVANGGSFIRAGSTAARDSFFGVPSTAAQRLALHNLGAAWQRTDKGWTEQYFATTADGVTAANGAVNVAGWYPVSGRLPYARRYHSNNGNISMGQPNLNTTVGFMGITSYATEDMPTADLDTVKVLVGGHYQCRATLTVVPTANCSFETRWGATPSQSAVGAAPDLTNLSTGWYTVLAGAYSTFQHEGRTYFPLRGGDLIRLKFAPNAATNSIVYQDTFFNEVAYVSPPFIQ